MNVKTARWVLVLSSVASLMVALDALVVATALETIRRHLHASLGELEWTVNAYGLSFAVLLVPAAALGDRVGRRRLFAAGLGLFVLASIACALAPDAGLLIAARAVQGSAAALVAPMSLALLSTAFPPERRGWAMGVYGGITGIAVLGGPVIGGAVTQGLAWQWVFWINVPIGLAAIPLVADAHPGELRSAGAAGHARAGAGHRRRAGDRVGAGARQRRRLDQRRGARRAGRRPGRAGGVRLGRAPGARADAAAADVRAPWLLGRDGGHLPVLGRTVQRGVLHGPVPADHLGQGPLDAGLRLLPWTGTLFFVAPVAGALTNRIGARTLVTLGLCLQAGGMAWVAAIASPGMTYWHTIAPMVIAGAGVSMAMPAAQSAVMNAVASRDVGKASGVFTTMRQLGGVFGLAVAAAVFTAAGSYASPVAFFHGFVPALTVSAVLSAVGALVAASLPRHTPQVEVSAHLSIDRESRSAGRAASLPEPAK